MSLDAACGQAQIQRMKNLRRVLGFALFFGLIPLVGVAADTTAPEVRLTVELRDGSRVVGVPVGKNFRFHSALLGELKLAVGDIRSVECVSSNAVKLTTANGDVLTVGFAESSFALKTGFGKIEIVAASLRKLTVSAAGAGGAHRSGLVALWSGEDSGRDSAGNHDAELTDITFADGKVGRAFALNGYSAWATIPAIRGFDLARADGLTITAWIKPSNVDGFHPILEWEVTRQKSAVMLWIGRRPQDHGVVSVNFVDTESNNHELASSPGTIVSGQFQHIAITYDKGTGKGRLFVNGRIVTEENFGLMTPETSGPLFFSRRPCDQPGDWTYNSFFSGLIDEVAIYDRGLSPEEISAICTEENRGELPPPGRTMNPWEGRRSTF